MLQCLLIDGSLTIQKVIKLALSKYDINISSLNSLHEASIFISHSDNKIDFIISDSYLEGTVTPETLKKLSIQAHAPILILNGSYQGVDEASFRKEGFFFFLKKPFESSVLVTSIESLIKKPLPKKDNDTSADNDQGINFNIDPSSENTKETFVNPPSFIPKPPVPPMEKTINIPPTISFKEELSLQEKKESSKLHNNGDDENSESINDTSSSFDSRESTVKTKLPLPPPPPQIKKPVKDFSIKEESIVPPPPPFIPDIPVDKNKFSKTISHDIDSLNLPPPPFIEKDVKPNINNNNNDDDDDASDSIFNRKLPPLPNIELSSKKDLPKDTLKESTEKTSNGELPFTPSKEFLDKNIEQIVKDYLDSNLENLIKQEVKNYCDAHFKNIATECIKEKINDLLEEKTSLSENS